MDLPEEFKNKMKTILTDSVDSFFECLSCSSQKGITVNYKRINHNTFDKYCDFEKEKIKHIENGYYVNNFKFSENIFNHLGIIYSQDPSAMYPVELLDIKPTDIVLDICASPGGKSIQILEKLSEDGLLISNEIVYNRAKILQQNIVRIGAKNCIVTCNNPEDFEEFQFKFDKILVDAPCGGEGMFRKNNFDIKNYNPKSIESNSFRQLKILESMKNLLKIGGRLVYSTCTYDIRENEFVIAKFLEKNTNFKIVKLSEFNDVMEKGIKVHNFSTDLGFRRYPHLHRGEGQFMIALEKTSDHQDNSSNKPIKFSKAKNFDELNIKELNLINKFFSNTLNEYNFDYLKKNENIYILPKFKINMQNLNVLTFGCLLGSIENQKLKIQHDFYHTYGEYFKNKIDLDKNQIKQYLHGEQLEVSCPNGLCVVTYLNIPIGGGKITNGKLQNYYPKELRI